MNTFLNALRRMFRTASRPSAPRGAPLRLEALEERCVPSMTQITNPTYPASAIVAVVSVFPDGQKIDSTGAMVDSDHVLTAGTAIYDPQYGTNTNPGWATQIAVFAGATSSTSYEKPSAYATLGRVEPAFYNTMNYNWATYHEFGETGAGIGDIGLLKLNTYIGTETGSFSLNDTTDGGSWTGATVYTLGYPEPLTDGFEMFQQNGPISGAVNAGHYENGSYDYGGIFPGPSSTSILGLSTFEFGYFDFSQGNIQEEPVQGAGSPYGAQSGSPLFHYDFGEPTIDGVMSAANNSTGYAEQITGAVRNDLESWMDADNLNTTGVAPSDYVDLAGAALQTQTTLEASASGPVSYGQSVTFTASVSAPDAPSPITGTVIFYDNGNELDAATLAGASSVSFSISTLGVGNHTITAKYFGDGDFQGSASEADKGSVVAGNSDSTLSASAASTTYGQPLTFTAYVSGSGSAPTGSVTFLDGGTVLGTATLNQNPIGVAEATFTTSALGVGSHSITAVYSGDSDFNASTSTAVTETVAAPPIYVVSAAPGAGVMRYDSATGWKQLTSANASQVAVDSQGDVVAELPGYGVWRYEDATGWRQLTSFDASQVGIADDGIVAAEIPGAGVWRYEDAAGWRQLTSFDASQLAVAGNGIVAVEISGNGVWRFEDAAGWRQLTSFNASQVAVDANGDVAAELPGNGVWRYEDAGGWQQLTSFDASQISIAGNGIVAVVLPGYGVWRFEDANYYTGSVYFTGTAWQQLTSTNASQVAVDANGDVAADLNGAGVWLYQDGLSWGQLNAANALDIGLAD